MIIFFGVAVVGGIGGVNVFVEFSGLTSLKSRWLVLSFVKHEE